MNSSKIPLWTYICFVVCSGNAQNLPSHAPSLSQAVGSLKKSGINLGVNYQDSGVVRGVRRRAKFPAPDHCGGRRITVRGAEKSQQCHKYFLQYSTFASERHQVRTRECQNCILSRVPSSLVKALGAVGLITNLKPTLPSHKLLMGINFRYNMLHEIYFKVVYPVEAHYITRQIFSVFVE